MDKILEQYNLKKEEIKFRLQQFKDLPEKEYFREFQFCLLTPQSSAQRCWNAVEQLSKLSNLNRELVYDILKTKTRFHKTKTNYITQSENTWKKIKPLLNNPDKKKLRNFLAKNIKGYGLKESSHFLRNIGKSSNQIAILDRHIIKNLQKLNIIQEPKIKSPKNYLEIENKFINFANSINIPPDELDLLWWSQENGEIFK